MLGWVWMEGREGGLVLGTKFFSKLRYERMIEFSETTMYVDAKRRSPRRKPHGQVLV